MLGEGILQDLHNDHKEVAALLERIGDSENGGERSTLFKEMSTNLLAYAKAEQQVALTAEERTCRMSFRLRVQPICAQGRTGKLASRITRS